MKKIKVIEGVVAEYNGKYWGIQYKDSYGETVDFGELEKAKISNPEFCKKATDMTSNHRYNDRFDKLKKARLVKVKKTITTEIEIDYEDKKGV